MEHAWTQQHWQQLANEGVLDAAYLRHLSCQGTTWDDFREQYHRHMEQGRWGWSDEVAWVTHPEHWAMVKSAERILQTWRRLDFDMQDVEPADPSGHGFSSAVSPERMRVVDKSLVSLLTKEHLDRFADPASESTCFGCKCLLGIVAAIAVLSRALVVAGSQAPPGDGGDGFLLWRQEVGFVLFGILLREGLLALDLTSAPVWPLVGSRLGETILHWEAPRAGAAGGVVLGPPRRLRNRRPERLPSRQRYHRGTDPAGVTEWGRRAREHAARHAEAVQRWWRTTDTPPGHPRRGPSFALEPPYTAGGEGWPPRRWPRARVLGLVAMHGALDLDVPELLRELFPDSLDVQFVLYGGSHDVQNICDKTEGSETIRRLCQERQPANAATHATCGTGAAWQRNLCLDPNDPRLLFARPGEASLPPELITMTSFDQAVWAIRAFPGVPVVVFIGPPLMLNMAEDIQNGRDAAVADFWDGFRDVADCARRGRCLLAAESLFRCEQFFYQTGVEIPFLRPMSVWVNATYRPSGPVEGARGEVLVHSRGRLKYEMFFIKGLQRMAGPQFRFDIVGQEGRIVPFREIAQFHAVVVLPWSPEICMLRHLFKMRVPTFVPDRALLQNLVHVSNRRLLPYPYNLPAPGSNRSAVKEAHEFDPFLDTARPAGDMVGLEARAYWAEFSEYLLLPALRHFAGAADLLAALHGMQGPTISAQMRNAYLVDLREARGFWRESLSRLLAAGPAAAGAAAAG